MKEMSKCLVFLCKLLEDSKMMKMRRKKRMKKRKKMKMTMKKRKKINRYLSLFKSSLTEDLKYYNNNQLHKRWLLLQL